MDIFGDATIYNPWSMPNYISNTRNGLKPYWVNSSSNDLVKVILSKNTADIALKQISDKKYITTLESRGITSIIEIATVFKGK